MTPAPRGPTSGPSSERWKDGPPQGVTAMCWTRWRASRRPCEKARTRGALLAAEAHGRLGDFATAAEWADRAWTLAHTGGDRLAELRARNYRGAIALRRGDVTEAEAHFNDGLEVARTLHDHAAEARGTQQPRHSRRHTGRS